MRRIIAHKGYLLIETLYDGACGIADRDGRFIGEAVNIEQAMLLCDHFDRCNKLGFGIDLTRAIQLHRWMFGAELWKRLCDQAEALMSSRSVNGHGSVFLCHYHGNAYGWGIRMPDPWVRVRPGTDRRCNAMLIRWCCHMSALTTAIPLELSDPDDSAY